MRPERGPLSSRPRRSLPRLPLTIFPSAIFPDHVSKKKPSCLGTLITSDIGPSDWETLWADGWGPYRTSRCQRGKPRYAHCISPIIGGTRVRLNPQPRVVRPPTPQPPRDRRRLVVRRALARIHPASRVPSCRPTRTWRHCTDEAPAGSRSPCSRTPRSRDRTTTCTHRPVTR